MGAKYEPVGKERFTVVQTERGEAIRIGAPRQIFAMLFLPFWLVMWTIGGVTAIAELIRTFEPFLVFWLCGWAAGWIAATGTLLWMFAGAETIAVVGGDLEVAHVVLGVSRRWLYQGAQIRNLAVAAQPGWPFQFQFQVPFFRTARNGAIKFDYGPRTIHTASGLDEGEARLVIERLVRRLPAAARA